MDQARNLKFSSYVHLPPINKIQYLKNMIQYRYACVILCSVGEVIIFESHGCYISTLHHIKMLMLSIYVLLACINPIYKYGHAWVI